MRHLLPCPPCGRQGRPGQGFLAGFIERPRGSAPRERDHRGGDRPGPIPNPAVKPAFAESTAARGCGRAGRRARGGRFSIGAERGPRGDVAPAGLSVFRGALPGGSPRSMPRAADLAGVRCVRGVRAERMDGFLCFCKWCCNSPGLSGASLASGVIWHLV